MVGVVVAASLSGCSFGHGWTHANTAMEAGFAGELALDTVQTREIVGACQEYNPVIGPCGDRMPYGAYTGLTMLAHAAIALALPPKYREVFQAFTLGVEGHNVYYNTLVPTQMTPSDARR